MLRNQISLDLEQSIAMTNDTMMAVDNEDGGIYQLEKGDGDAPQDDAIDARTSGIEGMTAATSLEEDSDGKEGSVKLVAAESAEEQVKEQEEASTQDEQISGNNNNELYLYEQMIVKMEELQSKLNKEQRKVNSLQHKLSPYEPKSPSQKMLMTGLADSSSQVKNDVIHLIINKYVSASSPEKLFEKLDNALEAIDFMHTDGEPVQVKGYPFLYVGSVGASLNGKSLAANNITHVVNWSISSKCNVFEGIEYRCIEGISGSDMSRKKNVQKLHDAVEFVEKARIAGGNVMSHCWYGRNRSVTLLVAYLMKYAGMGIDEATELIAETRPQADPYVEALELYQKHYLDTEVR